MQFSMKQCVMITRMQLYINKCRKKKEKKKKNT